MVFQLFSIIYVYIRNDNFYTCQMSRILCSSPYQHCPAFVICRTNEKWKFPSLSYNPSYVMLMLFLEISNNGSLNKTFFVTLLILYNRTLRHSTCYLRYACLPTGFLCYTFSGTWDLLLWRLCGCILSLHCLLDVPSDRIHCQVMKW